MGRFGLAEDDEDVWLRILLSIPIISGSGGGSGIIAMYRREPANPTTQERDLIDRLSKIAGITIDRARADEALNQARLELTHVARTATLSAMTASITHEVSQPISGILTNASTCARMLAADPPNVVGAAETIRRTIRDANRASEVIKRLRAMFAKKAPVMELVDLNETAQEVIAVSSGELRRFRSALETNFAEHLSPVSGDRVQLQQVILNLLLNAADAMAGIEDRPRTLRVRTEMHGSDKVKLLVQDAGVGLDPRAMEKLFEAFHTTKAHGLGIGLAISRSIIESHKGQLWAMPNEGPGATFGFSIPCASARIAQA
jgi:C4-dicarboxylate-specific signal transduction histidine kinase